MRSNDYDIDVAVAGGGPAGLAAATYAARAGLRVALFEKSSGLGGRAATQEHDGYLFNLGGHALYDGNPAVEVLRDLGVAYEAGSPVGVRTVRSNKNYLAPTDLPGLLRTDLLDRAAKWEAGRLLIKLQLANPRKYARVSVREWLDREIRNPDVRQFMEANARVATYTNAPDLLSMDTFVEQLQILSKGKVLYVHGGWQTLVDGLEKAARGAGALIMTRTEVEKVEQHNGTVRGVKTADGRIWRAGAVIVAAGPRQALQLAGGENAALQEWAGAAVPVSAASLDVSLRRLPRPENPVVIGVDRPLFLSVQSQFSRVAPEGGALLYSLKYLDPSVPNDAEATRRELEEWLDLTQPGWQAEVIRRRYLPHLTVSNALISAASGGTTGRPGPEVPGVRGLYVAGDWVGPRGALLSASLWSARLAAAAAVRAQSPAMLRAAA